MKEHDSAANLPQDSGQGENSWTDWVVENVGKPLYTGAVVQTVDVASNISNAVTFGHGFGKLDRPTMRPAESMTEQMVRTVSGGVGAMVPYLVASKVAGSAMRGAGYRMGLSGMPARVMASDTAAMIAGAALVDGARDVNPGETRIGNMGAGMVGFAVFGAGNHAVRDWSIPKRALAYPLIGAVGAEAQHVTAQFLSGQNVSFDDAGSVMLGGAAMNGVMPWASAGISKIMYSANARAGREVSADRFSEHNGLRGQSASLDAAVNQHPLAKVKVTYEGNGSRVDLANQKIAVDLADVRFAPKEVRDTITAERFGHELKHIPLAKGAEPQYADAASLLQKSREARVAGDVQSAETYRAQSREQFMAIRAEQEHAAQAFGMKVRGEVEGKAVAPNTVLTDAHKTLHESDWQLFEKTDGAYRPRLELQRTSEGYRLVLGAGGAKAYYALGALMAAERLGVPFKEYFGVSAGGDLAAGLANGMTARQLLKLTYESRVNAYDPTRILMGLEMPSTSGTTISLEKLWQPEVEKLGWKWPNNLRLLAAHKNSHTGEFEPRVLTNKDAQLATGLAATGAHEAVFKPVKVGNEYLVDGGHYHMNPVIPNERIDGRPAIVFRLNRVSEVPPHLNRPFWDPRAWVPEPDGLPPIVKKMLIEQEMRTPVRNDVDPQHVLVDLETKVAGLDFWVSKDEALQMVRDGYRQGFEQLKKAIADGRIVPKRDLKPSATRSVADCSNAVVL